MNRSAKIIITIVVIGGLVTAGAIRLINNKKEVETKIYRPDINTAVPIRADKVEAGKFELTNFFTGAFSPNREVVIGSETSGKVIKVNIEEGSEVNTGQLIAQLDDGLIQAQLQSAQASLDRATNTLNRYQQASSGITKLQLDNSQTDVQTSKAQVQQLKKQISQYSISAPFGGVITKKNFELGTIVSPGMQMATLTDISSLKLEINVPEKIVYLFSVGQTLDVSTDVYQGKTFKGKVELVASKADASHNFTIKILVPNANSSLKSGMYGTVILNSTVSNSALTIPRSALTGSSLKPQVYVVENGIAKLRTIEIGGGNETRVEVIKGLQSGDLVASGGMVNLTDGTKVTLTK